MAQLGDSDAIGKRPRTTARKRTTQSKKTASTHPFVEQIPASAQDLPPRFSDQIEKDFKNKLTMTWRSKVHAIAKKAYCEAYLQGYHEGYCIGLFRERSRLITDGELDNLTLGHRLISWLKDGLNKEQLPKCAHIAEYLESKGEGLSGLPAFDKAGRVVSVTSIKTVNGEQTMQQYGKRVIDDRFQVNDRAWQNEHKARLSKKVNRALKMVRKLYPDTF